MTPLRPRASPQLAYETYGPKYLPGSRTWKVLGFARYRPGSDRGVWFEATGKTVTAAYARLGKKFDSFMRNPHRW